MLLTGADFPEDRLEHRLEFLISRAEAHLDIEEVTMLARACAATLLRDAGCVALLLNKPRQARVLLHKSGRHYLTLGLPAGAALVALAGLGEAQAELRTFDDVVRGAREQWAPRDAREREGARRPMTDQARSEPQQLLAMMQADWLASERGFDTVTRDGGAELWSAARRNGGHPAGHTGLSIDSYIDLASWLSERRPFDATPPRFTTSLNTMMATRAENLRAARKDSFHWRMLARPAELIDLDATILMYLALGKDEPILKDVSPLFDEVRDDLPLVDAPVRAASAIRRDEDRPTGPAL